MQRTPLRFGAILLAAVNLTTSCGGSGPAEPETHDQPPEEEQPPERAHNPDRYAAVVLAYTGINRLNDGDPIETRGWEFVLGAEREYLEPIVTAVVLDPDGREWELQPSTVHGVSLDFYGRYGTTEGWPTPGDYVFRITFDDGDAIEVSTHHDGRTLEMPANVQAAIDHEGGRITVTWDPVEGVRNYTVALQDVLPGGVYQFVDDVGECPRPDDPNAGTWAETTCVIDGLAGALEEGNDYGVQIAVWSDFAYGGVDGAVKFVW